MRALLKKASTLTRIEFWAFSIFFTFVIFFFIMDSLEGDQYPHRGIENFNLFEKAGMPFNFFKHYFIPKLIKLFGIYAGIVALNFIVVPGLLKKKTFVRNLLLLIFVSAAIVLLNTITGTWLQGYRYATAAKETVNEDLFYNALEFAWGIICVVAFYTGIKHISFYVLAISESLELKYSYLRKEAVVATIIWMAGLLFLRFGRAEEPIIIGWAFVIPSAIALYLFSFYRLIPLAIAKSKRPFLAYFKKAFLVALAAFFIIYLVSIFITDDDDAGLGYSFFNAFFQLIITVPVSWIVYKKYLKGNEELQVLQKALNRSTANIDLLRSQINPHFLFNALNTLYGTAIQENADKTSEGIQKLGDMMRFMLQENMQDKISLAREIDYLKNYISLQRLRTDASPGIEIQIEIPEPDSHFQVAPMLLIPFVENAFKHGISFREPSYIKVTLAIKDNSLYFDVSNSKHTRPDNDPEKDKSGIGLENVKQRLKLSYPGKHDLIIRETPSAFFVHLTLQLSKFA